MSDYTEKYLKYKAKYNQLKQQVGAGEFADSARAAQGVGPLSDEDALNLAKKLSLADKPTPKTETKTKTVNYYYNHFLDPLYPRYVVADYNPVVKVVNPLYPPVFDVPVNTFDYYDEPETPRRRSKRKSSRKTSKRRSARKTSRKTSRKTRSRKRR